MSPAASACSPAHLQRHSAGGPLSGRLDTIFQRAPRCYPRWYLQRDMHVAQYFFGIRVPIQSIGLNGTRCSNHDPQEQERAENCGETQRSASDVCIWCCFHLPRPDTGCFCRRCFSAIGRTGWKQVNQRTATDVTRSIRTHQTLEELNEDLNSCSAIADRDLRLVKSRDEKAGLK